MYLSYNVGMEIIKLIIELHQHNSDDIQPVSTYSVCIASSRIFDDWQTTAA